MLIGAGGSDEQVELQVCDAVSLLGDLDGEVDAVITDPPWGLEWDTEAAQHQYARDKSKVLGGYLDVPSGSYLAFSRRWIAAAAKVLRPGGQLVVVTGPQCSAHVQSPPRSTDSRGFRLSRRCAGLSRRAGSGPRPHTGRSL